MCKCNEQVKTYYSVFILAAVHTVQSVTIVYMQGKRCLYHSVLNCTTLSLQLLQHGVDAKLLTRISLDVNTAHNDTAGMQRIAVIAQCTNTSDACVLHTHNEQH
jgi:hypothetical protein